MPVFSRMKAWNLSGSEIFCCTWISARRRVTSGSTLAVVLMGIGVFRDGEGSGSVLHEDGEQAGGDVAGGHPLGDGVRDFVKTFALSEDGEPVRELLQGGVTQRKSTRLNSSHLGISY